MTNSANDDAKPDRRHFSRIAFTASTRLSQGAKFWDVELIDLSLRGLLVAAPENWDADTELPFAVTISLANDTRIIMSLHWVHTQNQRIGFVCEHIDIDSITHLRKLVELNIGDASLLERELAALGE